MRSRGARSGLVGMAVIATLATACGGTTTGSVGHVERDAETWNAGGSSAGGASAAGSSGQSGSVDMSGSGNAGGKAATARLVACNDGTGKMDCCVPDAYGAPCDVAIGWCSSGCTTDGLFGSMQCGSNGVWESHYLGLLPCDRPVSCNDGTGRGDCCTTRVEDGRSCDGTMARCSQPCRIGHTSYFYCGPEGVWLAGKGSFACGGDGGW